MSNREKNPLGQYFTPYPIAKLMVDMLKASAQGTVLEPSSGEGVFLDALLDSGYQNVQGVEIDSTLPEYTRTAVDIESFITWNPSRKMDAVIGNPPYIRWKDLDAENKTAIQNHHLWGTLFNSLTDFLTVFIAKSVEHLKPGGELIFITPRFWMHTKNSAPLREWLLERGSFTDVIDYEEATVFNKVSSSIVIFRYVLGSQEPQLNLYRYIGPRKVPANPALEQETLYTKVRISQFKKYSLWTLATPEEQAELNTLEEGCIVDGISQKLGNYMDIANGLVSGRDAAFQIPGTVFTQLNDAEKAATIQVLKAKNFAGFRSDATVPYIYIPDDVTNEEEFKTTYPHFYALLKPLEADLLKRHSYIPNLPYWAWAFKRSEIFHLNGQPKIFVPCKERLTNRGSVRFTVPLNGGVATQDVTSLAPKQGVKESVEYVTAFLTLPEMADWVKLKGLMKGGVAEFSEAPLANLPFRPINWENPEEVEVHSRVTGLIQGIQPGDTSTAAHQLIRGLLL